SVGRSDHEIGIFSSRSDESFADAMSCAALSESESGHSMLDWPDATQTSPTITSSIATRSPAASTESVKGPPAAVGKRETDHFPLRSAMVRLTRGPSRTVTGALAAAHPHTGTRTSRWTTIPLPNSFG